MSSGSGPSETGERDAARFDAFEAAGWQRAAGAYDRMIGKLTRQVIDRLLDAVGLEPGHAVLDLATGPGHVAGRAAERGAVVTGLDITEAMLDLAREAHPEVTFRLGDMQQLPFDDEAFDAVVANFGILHAARPDRVVAEATRVLRPGGCLALTVWDVPQRSRGFAVVLDALAEVGAQPPPDLPPGPPFFLYADDAEFGALLEQGGLADVTIATLTVSQQVESADDWWDGLLDGAVRTTALIRGQTEDVQIAVRTVFTRNFEELRSGTGYAVPMGVKLAAGRRPPRE